MANRKLIGIQFYPNKVLNALIKGLKEIAWSNEHDMFIIPNNPKNINTIFKTFKGVAWVNCKYFFPGQPVSKGVNDSIKIKRKKIKTSDWQPCPESFIQKLELKRYALNTAQTYISNFEKYVNYFHPTPIDSLNENDIRMYLAHHIKLGYSDSSLNQAVNSIKFYYEIVMGMPNRFYNIERPSKKLTLPKVISKEEAKALIDATNNIKHKCIASLLYSAGLRRAELINLKYLT